MVGDLLFVLQKVVILLLFLASELATYIYIYIYWSVRRNRIFRVNLNFQICIALGMVHDFVEKKKIFFLLDFPSLNNQEDRQSSKE